MKPSGLWICLIFTAVGVVCASIAGAQCDTFRENNNPLDLDDFEYVGLASSGQRWWVGQEFSTDCDGQFLTVSFGIAIQQYPEGGIDPLGSGDILTCTVMDDQNRPIASVDKSLTQDFGTEWVTFDFEPLELGLAAGTLAVKVSTRADGFCRVVTSPHKVPGQLMLGTESTLDYIPVRDTGFRVTWDPEADIADVEPQSWGDVKALYR